MTPARPRVHDLLRVPAHSLVDAAGGDLPSWFDPGPAALVWVVVRRTAAVEAVVDVGVRGVTRDQRWAAVVPTIAVVGRASPASVPRVRGRVLPAFTALALIAPVADQAWPGAWGPAGSVGYELVTGQPVVSTASDLDLVVYADDPLDRSTVAGTLSELRRRAGPVRLDLLVETPVGGFAADEWLAGSPHGLALRTPRGPELTAHPWVGA